MHCSRLEPSVFSIAQVVPRWGDPEMERAFESVVHSQWMSGNTIETLANGDAYFPRMLQAIKSAEKTITFESFVVVGGQMTYELCVALMERAKAGVNVHVILDGVGSRKLDARYLSAMRSAGVEVELYQPFNCFRPWQVNHRDHRKILVVDGKLGYVGGAGYADVWCGSARQRDEWRDTQYEVRGPIVADLQRAFADNWRELRNEELEGVAYYPVLKSEGKMKVQAVLGAPQQRGDTVGASYLLALDGASKSILIEHAYFVPNEELIAALLRARARGVEVKVIVPNEHIDTPIVREASKATWPKLLAAGVQIYEFQTSMMHAKLIVVDDELSIIGSGNFDDRSFFINDEFNLNVLDRQFASEQVQMFNQDLVNCRQCFAKDAKASWARTPQRWFATLISYWL